MLLETSENFGPLVVLDTVWQVSTQTVRPLMVLRYAWTGFSVDNTHSNPYFSFSQTWVAVLA